MLQRERATTIEEAEELDGRLTTQTAESRRLWATYTASESAVAE